VLRAGVSEAEFWVLADTEFDYNVTA